jgi:hypothetical protein
MMRINSFAERIASTMTNGVLSRIELPSRDVLANLRELREEVRTFGNTIRNVNAGETPILQSKIERLEEALGTLNVSVDRLRNARTILSDEAIGQLGRSITETLLNLRGCVPNAGKVQPYGEIGTNPTKSGTASAFHVKGGM